MRYQQRLNVSFAYDVVFTRDLFAEDNAALAGVLPPSETPHKAAVFIDQGVLDATPGLAARISAWCAKHADRVALASAPVTVPGGEAVKNDLTFVQRMTHQFQRLELCRHSFVIAVGGGAVLDAVGLAAAVFHRGIRLIRVPTTVLSQDDSGMGVKNGINLDGVKNLIGAFAPPYAVLCDLQFLTTLERRDWCGGVSEAFKVALIKDAAFLAELEALAPRIAARDLDAMARVVERCAVLHLDHIAGGGDPFESGSARPLDFGHWSAHKLESMSRNAIRHGEAVGVGIALDLFLSAKMGLITEAERDRVCAAMEAAGLDLWHPMLARPHAELGLEVVKGLEEFRQHLGGRLTLAMPDGLGRKRDVHALDHAHIREGVAWLAARAGTTLEEAQRKQVRETA
ncbi:MAG: 3-dehydroquinate synthase [Planctomycetota bacterium]|nr:3-dehydroquinate synthase [Planctomycetota bacterium]